MSERRERSGEQGFPTALAAKLAGVSQKTLENWVARGLLTPSIASARGRGSSRVYSFRDVIAVRVADKLRNAGIPTSSLRRVVAYLRARKGLSPTEALASTKLVTDGRDVYEVDGTTSVSTLMRPGQHVLFMVPLDEVVTELQAKARALHLAA